MESEINVETRLPGMTVFTGLIQDGNVHVTPQGIFNMRDFHEAWPKIRPGRVWRSSSPGNASYDDARVLRCVYKIQAFIDLRGENERKFDQSWSMLGGGGTRLEFDLISGSLQHSIIPGRALRCQETPETRGIMALNKGTSSAQRHDAFESAFKASDKCDDQSCASRAPAASQSVTVYQTPLAPASLVICDFLERYGHLPPGAKFPVSRAPFNEDEERSLRVLAGINHLGLGPLYEVLLDHSGPAVREALFALLSALQRGEGVALFCHLGKNRTGLMSALILGILGAPDAAILDDYAASAGQVDPAAQALALENMRLPPDAVTTAFDGAHPEDMAWVLGFLRAVYQGIGGYLDAVGFGEDLRRQLRAELLV